jgi:hypothetical protein
MLQVNLKKAILESCKTTFDQFALIVNLMEWKVRIHYNVRIYKTFFVQDFTYIAKMKQQTILSL